MVLQGILSYSENTVPLDNYIINELIVKFLIGGFL